MKLFFATVLSTLMLSPAFAAPTLTNLSQGDVEAVSKEFSSNFSHASVLGASSLGTIFGFQVALLAGQTPSPEADKIAKKNGASDGMPNLYHGGVLVAISVPLGFTGELTVTPKVSASGLTYSQNSAALKWTMDESFFLLPLNMGVRAFKSSSFLEFKQTSNGIDGTVTNNNSVQGLQLLFSPKTPLIEPYIGVGYLQAVNRLGFNASSGSIFNFTQTDNYETSLTTTQLLAGVTANLLVFHLGLEYSKAFDASRYTAKIGFGF